MADLNKKISIGADTSDAEAALSRLGNKLDSVSTGNTKVTKSTQELGKAQKVTLQSVLANGGAMGTLSGIVGQSAMAFKDATEAVELTGVSLKGLRGAIIATGLGALVVVVGELVANWDKWVGVIDGSTKKMEELNERRRQLGLETERLIQQQEHEIKLLEINGASSRRILQEKYANTVALIEAQKLALTEAEREVNITNKSADAIKKRNDERTKLIGLENQLVTLSAEFDKLERDKKEENIAKAIKKREEAEKAAHAQLQKTIASSQKYIQVINNINLQTKKYADIDLSQHYLQVRNLTDAYFENRKALQELAKLRSKLSGQEQKDLDVAINLGGANQDAIRKEIELVKERFKISQENEDKMNVMKTEALQLELELMKLDGERSLNTIEYGEYRIKALVKEDELLKNRTQQETSRIESEIKNLEKRKAISQKIVNEFLSNESRVVQYAELVTKAETDSAARRQLMMMGLTEQERNNLDERAKLYIQHKDIVADIENTIGLKSKEMSAIDSASKLETETLYYQASLDAKQATADAMLAIDENYAQASQMAYSNLYGFINVLQDENLIKSKGIRDALLVLEKGLAIAGVWIEEAKSSAQVTANLGAVPTVVPAGPYSIPNPMLPTAIANAARAKVMNKVSAGIATATILAQTMASFKSGGGGSNGGGGGAAAYNPPAQFNMVGNSGQNQLAQTIGEAQNRPVNAYVVTSDVSTAQELERNRIQNSTFL